MYLNNMHIAPYEEGNRFNHDPYVHVNYSCTKRNSKLGERTREIGYSIIPLKLYLKHGQCKVLLGVARGKRNTTNVKHLKKKR